MPTIDFESLQQLFPTDADIPEDARLPAPIHQRVSLVDGELVPWDGTCKTVLSPVCVRQASGEAEQVAIGSYPVMGETESDAALDAAVRAYDHGRGAWPTMTVGQRIACMQDFIRRMVAERHQIVNLIMWEIGKSLADSQKEFDRTVSYMQDTIEALKEQDNSNSRFTIAEGTIGQIRRAPLGVVLCMGPYNYPLNETFATLIPALLMGNTVVFKPPQYGTLLFYPLLAAFRDAFPKGVINTIYAPGAVVVPHMLASGKVDVLALIGSSKVADHLKKQHPKSHRLRAILGLDAKNAAIILPDADIDLAVKECLLGALSFNGQRCTALKMLMVHRSIVDTFLERFTAQLGKLKVGMPWEKGVIDHAAARAASNRLHDRGHRRRQGERRARRQRRRRRVLPDALLPGRGLPGAGGHDAVPRGAVRADHPGHAVRRCRNRAAIRDHIGPRPAGQHLRDGPRADRRAGRSARQPGVPRQPELPVPARA